MPPRFAYWTIILDGKPTAFRAREADELLPTLRQLQVRHPEAVMLWFAGGRLWSSPEEARAAAEARRSNRDRRGPGWRPGGEHRDPRDRFKVPRDEKRRRFAEKLHRDRRDQPTGGENPSRPAGPSKFRRGPRPTERARFRPASNRPKGSGGGRNGNRGGGRRNR